MLPVTWSGTTAPQQRDESLLSLEQAEVDMLQELVKDQVLLAKPFHRPSPFGFGWFAFVPVIKLLDDVG